VTRVSGTPVAIDADAVRAFFEQRAARAASAHPLTSVLYQDQDPGLAAARDTHEKAVALPLLALDPSLHVLDLGCGIGRWADAVAPLVAGYVGIDYSAGLVEAARARVDLPGTTFVQLPVQDADPGLLGRPQGFDRLLLAGVLLYLNDDVLLPALSAAASCAAPACRVWLREPVATQQRLTLAGHFSQDLGCDYSAVYRTQDELLDAVGATFGAAGFSVLDVLELYPPALNNRTETVQRAVLLERRA
jgi:SAM-dependent methyltransferase